MDNIEMYIAYSKAYVRVDGRKVKLSSELMYEIMESDDFIHYCTKERNLNESNITHYCLSKTGKKVSPRWVLEYIVDKKDEWFVTYEKEKLRKYGHTNSGRKIFELLKIQILSC